MKAKPLTRVERQIIKQLAEALVVIDVDKTVIKSSMESATKKHYDPDAKDSFSQNWLTKHPSQRQISNLFFKEIRLKRKAWLESVELMKQEPVDER